MDRDLQHADIGAIVGRWLWRMLSAAVVLAVVVGIGRWLYFWFDLNRSDRLTAWEQMRRENVRGYGVTSRTMRRDPNDRGVMVFEFHPNATKLWLAAGFDPNGNDCGTPEMRPAPFALAVLKPLGICKPHDSGGIPFFFVTFYGFTPEAREVAKLMIAAGANVNAISPDGIVPLRSAVSFRNVEMVQLLLQAGADPLLKPTYNQLGDLRSALEVAESLSGDPRDIWLRDLVRAAARDRRRDAQQGLAADAPQAARR